MTWFVFEYRVPQLLHNRKPKLYIKRWVVDFLLTQKFYWGSTDLQRVLKWSSSPLTAAAIITLQRYKARMHIIYVTSSTCRFFSAAIDQLHLTIEIIIGASKPYPLFLPLFLLWLSSVVCYHPTPGENLFFAAGHLSPSSIRSILCSPISPQICTQPRCMSRVLSCSSALRSAFRQSGEWHATGRHSAELLRAVDDDFGFWILDFSRFWRRWRRWLFGPHKMSTYEALCPMGVCLKIADF